MESSKSYRVGISCIGSGVGQSVINSCRLSRLPIKTIGLGTNPMAYGLYECDEYAYTASYYDEHYIENMFQVCEKCGLDLLIPGHDDEAYTLSKHISKFEEAGIQIIVSGPKLLSLCREKDQLSLILNPIANIFVRSFTKNDFLSAWQKNDVELPVIAKPRDGYASKGIEIILCEKDFSKITNAYIVQELAIPEDGDPNRDFYLRQISNGMNPQVAEVSVQYVLDRTGRVIGNMASYNRLNNGVPIEILPFENERMWADLDKLLPALIQLGARGPLNLQGRITNQGLKLFEINARFTGITGLRAVLGFNEVEACMSHWLEGEYINSIKVNQNRVGIRQTADKVVTLDRNPEIAKMVTCLNRGPLKKQKTILVTGSTGSIGRRLVKLLAKNPSFEILTLDRDKAKAAELTADTVAHHFDWHDLEVGVFNLGNVDRLVHLASARPHHGSQLIAQSLDSTLQFFAQAIQNGIHEIIHISSQSVYGHATKPPWKESDVPAPETPYAQAKYSIEAFLSVLARFQPALRHTSLRLATVTGPDPEIAAHEAFAKITQRLINGQSVEIRGGDQQLERIDVRDAADAIKKVVESDSVFWQAIYNVGTGQPVSLIEAVNRIVSKLEPERPSVRNLVTRIPISDEHLPSFGLDVSKFRNDFAWQPMYLNG
jgi:nucleoside-diphosphate-sugar epimerase/biotin carboxylase